MSAPSIHWQRDADRVVTITLDEPGPAGEHHRPGVHGRVVGDRRGASSPSATTIAGVVVTSGKETFLGGADLNAIVA